MGTLGFNNKGQLQVGGTPVDYGRNYIINGGFDYWNYATSQTTSGYGSDDRWINAHSGSTKSHLQQPTGDVARALFSASKVSETVVTSVAGAGNYVNKCQAIENVTKLAGKTVTLSFWAKADSSKNIAIELLQNFGTGGSPSSTVFGIGSQLVALTSTWQKKTITIAVPSIVGKTLGSDGVHTTKLGLGFWFDAGSDFNARTASLGQQSGTFDIAEVKLEEGSVATPWTPYEGEFGGELQACQRYYEKSFNQSIAPAQNAGTAGAIGFSQIAGASLAGMLSGYTTFKVKKRVSPTITLFNPQAANAQIRNISRGTDCTSTAQWSGLDDNGFIVSYTTAAGSVVGDQCMFHYTASSEL